MGFSLKLCFGFVLILATVMPIVKCGKIPYYIGDTVVMVDSDSLSAIHPFYQLLKSGLPSRKVSSTDDSVHPPEIENSASLEQTPQFQNPSLPFAVNDDSLLDIKILPGSTSPGSFKEKSVSDIDMSGPKAVESLIKQLETGSNIAKDKESTVHRVLQEHFYGSAEAPEVVAIKREQIVDQDGIPNDAKSKVSTTKNYETDRHSTELEKSGELANTNGDSDSGRLDNNPIKSAENVVDRTSFEQDTVQENGTQAATTSAVVSNLNDTVLATKEKNEHLNDKADSVTKHENKVSYSDVVSGLAEVLTTLQKQHETLPQSGNSSPLEKFQSDTQPYVPSITISHVQPIGTISHENLSSQPNSLQHQTPQAASHGNPASPQGPPGYPSSQPASQEYISSQTISQQYPSQPGNQEYPSSQHVSHGYPSQTGAQEFPSSQPVPQGFPSSQPVSQEYPSQPESQGFPSSHPASQAFPSSQPVSQEYPSQSESQGFPSSHPTSSSQPVTPGYISQSVPQGYPSQPVSQEYPKPVSQESTSTHVPQEYPSPLVSLGSPSSQHASQGYPSQSVAQGLSSSQPVSPGYPSLQPVSQVYPTSATGNNQQKYPSNSLNLGIVVEKFPEKIKNGTEKNRPNKNKNNYQKMNNNKNKNNNINYNQNNNRNKNKNINSNQNNNRNKNKNMNNKNQNINRNKNNMNNNNQNNNRNKNKNMNNKNQNINRNKNNMNNNNQNNNRNKNNTNNKNQNINRNKNNMNNNNQNNNRNKQNNNRNKNNMNNNNQNNNRNKNNMNNNNQNNNRNKNKNMNNMNQNINRNKNNMNSKNQNNNMNKNKNMNNKNQNNYWNKNKNINNNNQNSNRFLNKIMNNKNQNINRNKNKNMNRNRTKSPNRTPYGKNQKTFERTIDSLLKELENESENKDGKTYPYLIFTLNEIKTRSTTKEQESTPENGDEKLGEEGSANSREGAGDLELKNEENKQANKEETAISNSDIFEELNKEYEKIIKEIALIIATSIIDIVSPGDKEKEVDDELPSDSIITKILDDLKDKYPDGIFTIKRKRKNKKEDLQARFAKGNIESFENTRRYHKIIIQENNGETKLIHETFPKVEESEFESYFSSNTNRNYDERNETPLITYAESLKVQEAPEPLINEQDDTYYQSDRNAVNERSAALTTLNVRGRDISMNVSFACGVPQTQRIIGGKLANIKQHPWMVQILFKKTKSPFCGGTIINDRYILTAAHCLNFITVNKVLVRVEHTRPGRRTEGKTVKPKKLIVHERYKDSVIEKYDIGLIQLEESLRYSEKALPICLTPKADTDVNGLNGVITGWGIFEEGSRSPSDVLRAAFVKISDEVKCKKESSYKAWELNESVVCASETKIDSCQGDSGGPLSYVVEELGVYAQAGITSWGLGCARKKYPGVYTEVSYYYDWILENTPDAVWSCFAAWNSNCKNQRRVQPIQF